MTDKITDQEIEEVLSEFLPEGYNVPSGEGNYTRLEQGENKFRILQSPILGYELWVDQKPKRYKMDEQISIDDVESSDIDERTGEPRLPKHFWAMVVYNYNSKRIQILELTQKTILRTIKGLAMSKDWGSPLNYDISIVRDGKGFDTNYEVIPSPPQKLSKEVEEAWSKLKDKIDINKLFTGDDPFGSAKADK